MTELTKTTEPTPENGADESNGEFEVKPADTVQIGAIVAIEYPDFPEDPPDVFKIVDATKDKRPQGSSQDGVYVIPSSDELSQAVLGYPIGSIRKYTGREYETIVIRIVDFKNPS